MNEIISLSYWFNSKPEPISLFGQKTLAAISAISGLIFIIIIIRAYSEKLSIYKPSIDKLLPFCITNIIISLYVFFVNYELIPMLRSKFWYAIWFLIAVIWIIMIIKDFFKRAKRRQGLVKEAERKKYLP
jgi:hypothetical protein